MNAIASIKSDEDWRALLSYLPEGYERLAHEHRVINTQWPNAKVTDAQTLLRFILLHVGADLPCARRLRSWRKEADRTWRRFGFTRECVLRTPTWPR